MSDVQIGLSGLGLLLVFIALRIPIGISLIGVSFGGLWVLMGWKVAWGSLGLLPFQHYWLRARQLGVAGPLDR